jgi:hypothetical protein
MAQSVARVKAPRASSLVGALVVCACLVFTAACERSPAGPDSTVQTHLNPAAVPPHLNPAVVPLDPGDYTATISMDLSTAHDLGTIAPCAGFPADMASRSYNATITAGSGAYDRILSFQAPTVFSNAQVGLSRAERFIGFEMDFPFTEEFTGFRYLNIMGGAPTPTQEPVTVSDTGVSIPIFALFQYCELQAQARRGWENCQHAGGVVRFHACASSSARMVLSKR